MPLTHEIQYSIRDNNVSYLIKSIITCYEDVVDVTQCEVSRNYCSFDYGFFRSMYFYANGSEIFSFVDAIGNSLDIPVYTQHMQEHRFVASIAVDQYLSGGAGHISDHPDIWGYIMSS